MKAIYKLIVIVLFFSTLSCGINYNSYRKGNLYKFNIEVDQPITKDKKVPIVLEYFSEEPKITFEGKIEKRGGYSISFPKQSYEIDLKMDFPLANLPEDDDWILNANFIDKSFLRHVISYELFMAMDKNNEASRSEYVEVDINGKYNGLYVLMEKLDKSSLNIKNNDSTAVIYKEPHLFRTTYENVTAQDSNNFHQQTFPKLKKNDKSEFIHQIRQFIMESSDDNFKKSFSKLFDLNNIIDWHLLLMISNNSDGILKNFYLYKKDKKTPLRIAPWDYDHSFGRDGDNELNLDERPLNIERSILFARLLKYEWYKDLLRLRWNTLNNNNLLSKKGLKQRILSKSGQIRDLAMKNFKRWPLDASQYYDSNNFDQEIAIMLKFIELRHKRLTTYFANL